MLCTGRVHTGADQFAAIVEEHAGLAQIFLVGLLLPSSLGLLQLGCGEGFFSEVYSDA